MDSNSKPKTKPKSSFELWADRTFGSKFKDEEMLTYFRMSAAWDNAQEPLLAEIATLQAEVATLKCAAKT
jgi:hypothetical protein